MPQSSFALLTNTGRNKEAAALGNGTAVIITHIAIGDGATVPSGGETQLYNEVARKTISGQGVVSGAPTVAYADIYLAAADGPFTIHEAGLIDEDGDLIAIAHYDPPINKPTPDSGQTVEGTIRLEVAFTDLAAVTIKVDPSMLVALQRLSVLPWIPVLSVSMVNPPANPALGDTYVIPDGATGSWATHGNKVAEYTAAGWAIITPKDGHGVGLPNGRVFSRRGGIYVELLATETFKGLIELATDAETQTGTDTGRAVTPAGVKAAAAQFGLFGEAAPGNSNFNLIMASGIYTMLAGGTNGPAGSSSGTLVALKRVSGIRHTFYPHGGYATWERYSTDAGATWSAWRELAPVATDVLQGIVELATGAETQTGTDATRAVTPAGLSARTATETRTGLVQIATQTDANNGEDAGKVMTPAVIRGLKVPNFRFERSNLSLAEGVTSTTFNFDTGAGLVLMPASTWVNNVLTINEPGLWDFLFAVRSTGISGPGFLEASILINGEAFTTDTAGKTSDFNEALGVTYSETRSIQAGFTIQGRIKQRNTGGAALSLYVRFLGKRVAN